MICAGAGLLLHEWVTAGTLPTRWGVLEAKCGYRLQYWASPFQGPMAQAVQVGSLGIGTGGVGLGGGEGRGRGQAWGREWLRW